MARDGIGMVGALLDGRPRGGVFRLRKQQTSTSMLKMAGVCFGSLLLP